MSDVPYRIGVCMDWNTSPEVLADFYGSIRLACDEGFDAGLIKRPVELVVSKVKGPMAGLNSDVLRAYKQLAYEENVLAILGPVVTEANLALAEEVTRARVPTISFCATLDWAGPYAYALPNGAFVDEAPLLAAYIAKQGWTKVGVSLESGTIGDEFYAAFRQAAALYGLDIVSAQTVGLYKMMQPVRPQLEAIKAAGAQCLLALSGYGAVRYVIEEVRKMREEGLWDLPCLKNLYPAEGWIGLHQVHPGNPVYSAMLDRFEARHGRRPTHAYVPLGYDHGQVVVEALGTMKPPSPQGFKAALERVRMAPAAIGAPGTKISFGSYDQRGYKGEYIVFGTIRDGKEEVLDIRWADILKTPAEVLKKPPKIAPMAMSAPGGARGVAALAPEPATPYRVGVCQDFIGRIHPRVDTFFNGARLAFEEAYELGVLDRPVELVIREQDSTGSLLEPHVSAQDWRKLALEDDCLAIIGPHWTDVCLVVREDVERYKVPTISHCATLEFKGEYCFAAPNGTFMDETFLIAQHLMRRGARSVGVVREDNPIGDEYYAFFRRHCRRLGLSVASDQIVTGEPVPGEGAVAEMERALQAIRASGAESVAHMGLGRTFPLICRAMMPLVKDGWDVPRVGITVWVNMSGMTHSPTPWNKDIDKAPLEGWVAIDLPHERNQRFLGFLDRYAQRFGQRVFNCYPAHMYDMAWTLAIAISRARPVTPAGVKTALEGVRMLPTTMGSPGTVMSFGPYDHRGYKGAEYLVLRTMKDGVEGLVEDVWPSAAALPA